MIRTFLLLASLSSGITIASKYEFDTKERIVYTTVGERELLLDAFVPKANGSFPAVLVVHGGAWKMGNRRQLHAYAQELTKRGAVCFAIDYRLAPKHKFPAQIDDCRSAVRWIRQHADDYKVDPTRLGAIGYSAGGHLVSLLATTGEPPTTTNGNIDTRLQVVAAGGAPTEFRKFPDKGNWATYWMGGNLETVPDKFEAASPTAFVDKDDAPIFFFNGTSDDVVPLKWSMTLHEALKDKGVRTELHKIPNAGHLQAAVDPAALEAAYAFLMDGLKVEK